MTDEEAGPQMAWPIYSRQGHIVKCLQAQATCPLAELIQSSQSPYYYPTIQMPSLNE